MFQPLTWHTFCTELQILTNALLLLLLNTSCFYAFPPPGFHFANLYNYPFQQIMTEYLAFIVHNQILTYKWMTKWLKVKKDNGHVFININMVSLHFSVDFRVLNWLNELNLLCKISRNPLPQKIWSNLNFEGQIVKERRPHWDKNKWVFSSDFLCKLVKANSHQPDSSPLSHNSY